MPEQHHVKIYTLSTCGWCKKLKALLNDLGIDYDYVDVDKLSPDDMEKAREEVKKYNPRCSFPTMVIDGGKDVIVGFHEEKVRGALCE